MFEYTATTVELLNCDALVLMTPRPPGAGMLPGFSAKVELDKIVTCVTPRDKFHWVELFVDSEAIRFANDGRDSSA